MKQQRTNPNPHPPQQYQQNGYPPIHQSQSQINGTQSKQQYNNYNQYNGSQNSNQHRSNSRTNVPTRSPPKPKKPKNRSFLPNNHQNQNQQQFQNIHNSS